MDILLRATRLRRDKGNQNELVGRGLRTRRSEGLDRMDKIYILLRATRLRRDKGKRACALQVVCLRHSLSKCPCFLR